VNNRNLPPANIVIMVSGAIMLIASFLAFYKISTPVSTLTLNAWDRGIFMTATLPALLGALMALQIGLVAFGNITMPNRVLGLTWDQFHIVLSFQAALLMLTLLAREPNLLGIPTTFGVGFWVMLFGSGGLVLGAFMRVVASRRRPRAI